VAQSRYMTGPQLAMRLGVSRTTVYNKIKSGEIGAEKVGGLYIIPASEAHAVLSGGLTAHDKSALRAVVQKAVDQYGPVFEWLGKC